MTRVYVDISLFTLASSVGVINGHLDLETVPKKGEAIAFDRPRNAAPPLEVAAFTPSLTVEHVSPPVAGTTEVMLSLADITVISRADALKVAEYLTKGFGL